MICMTFCYDQNDIFGIEVARVNQESPVFCSTVLFEAGNVIVTIGYNPCHIYSSRSHMFNNSEKVKT